MATKKGSTPVLEEPVNEDKMLEEESGKLDAMARAAEAEKLKAQIEALKAENEKLRRNSVAASGSIGAKSDYERVKESCMKAAEEGADSWKVKISVRSPRRPAKEDPYYWLSVNGNTLQLPADDKYYDLALPYANALVDAIAAEWLAADYSDSIENYDPVTNPKKE